MKKHLAKILLVVLAALTVFALPSCSMGPHPEMDFEKAEAALTEAGYTVNLISDKAKLDAGIEKLLIAQDGTNRLSMIMYSDKALAKLAFEDIEQEYEAQIDGANRDIKRIQHILDQYSSELDDEAKEDYNEDLESLRKQLTEFEKYLFGRNGNVVWSATEDAVNATK